MKEKSNWPYPPPRIVMDDSGVRHVQEVEDPGEYRMVPCKCGIIHPLEADTWYHKPYPLTATAIPIFRACKECREILEKELIE